MGKLEVELKEFHKEMEYVLELKGDNLKTKLNNAFLKLAESFLYGGYISVTYNNKERYQIYLRTVEFYCHSEKENAPEYLIDPIVYHRNGRYVGGEREKDREVPYFPLMALHAHASGYDITFENSSLKLRSSALIRAYEVYDVERKKFLTYNTKDKKFVACQTGEKRVSSQSTYLYYFLNGFVGESVKWEDDIWKAQDCKISTSQRQNVYLYKDKGEGQYDYDLDKDGKKQKDGREWRFTRTEDLPF